MKYFISTKYKKLINHKYIKKFLKKLEIKYDVVKQFNVKKILSNYQLFSKTTIKKLSFFSKLLVINTNGLSNQ